MSINRYIKELLLLNDCVIIPEFGGFVANYKVASVNDGVFAPPSKEVVFNNKLTSNDGLLINYISIQEGIGYFDARQKLENFVEQTFLKLEQNGTVSLEGIGQLHYDSKENLLFEPQLNQNLLVDSYGLERFSYKKLYQRQMPKPAYTFESRDAVQAIFNKRKIRTLMVGIPLLFALSLIPLKNNKEYLSKSDMSMITNLTETKTEIVEEVLPVNSETTIAETVVEEAEIPEVKTVEYKYYLIAGSFRSTTNANNFIQQLQKQGYDAKNLGIYNGLNRIAMKGFTDFEEAKLAMNEYRAEYPQSGVWIHIN